MSKVSFCHLSEVCEPQKNFRGTTQAQHPATSVHGRGASQKMRSTWLKHLPDRPQCPLKKVSYKVSFTGFAVAKHQPMKTIENLSHQLLKWFRNQGNIQDRNCLWSLKRRKRHHPCCNMFFFHGLANAFSAWAQRLVFPMGWLVPHGNNYIVTHYLAVRYKCIRI